MTGRSPEDSAPSPPRPRPDDDGIATAARVWRRQSQWSQAAGRLKAGIGRARLAGLLLGTAAAVLGTAAAQLMGWNAPLGKGLAFGSAAAAALVPIVVRGARPETVRDWTRLRSISEALKSEVYVFLAGAGPYRGPDRAVLLLERTDRVQADGSDLTRHLTGLEPVRRELPDITGIGGYVTRRVEAQLDGYYRPGARRMRRRVTAVRRIEIALGALGAVLGALAGAFAVAQAAAWVAVATTVAVAVATHSAASRYEYQELEFSRTADQLERLLARRTAMGGGDPEADDEFVAECELVISAQNEAWMAKVSGDE
ncbi:Protein of unknown function [Thermomonospora echinospora]|uniref:SMODS and SLOG-associating 2TM effector domain-containing protein n=1 Tax=Thermomonospora echinospora TaxID=1992 RepID=A0A1H5ZXC9_9ACTN|nr:DUF4231 domain-containing protein [Thermomonospora echinospora]SEG40435.1 Protein of unknown function [Thermomonospora echinospora]